MESFDSFYLSNSWVRSDLWYDGSPQMKVSSKIHFLLTFDLSSEKRNSDLWGRLETAIMAPWETETYYEYY